MQMVKASTTKVVNSTPEKKSNSPSKIPPTRFSPKKGAVPSVILHSNANQVDYEILQGGYVALYIHKPNNPKKQAYFMPEQKYILKDMVYYTREYNLIVIADRRDSINVNGAMLASPDQPDFHFKTFILMLDDAATSVDIIDALVKRFVAMLNKVSKLPGMNTYPKSFEIKANVSSQPPRVLNKIVMDDTTLKLLRIAFKDLSLEEFLEFEDILMVYFGIENLEHAKEVIHNAITPVEFNIPVDQFNNNNGNDDLPLPE